MNKRFTFFAALAVFLAIAVTPANAAKPLKIVKGPYLQQLTPETIVIMWETNTAADSQVDYDDGVSGPVSFYVDESVKIHEIELTGLAADAYYYTVTSGTTTSPTSTFATAPAAPRNFRFVAYGDTRSQPSEHAAVIEGIIASAPEIVIHTGDLVESGDDYGQWGRQFFDPAYALMINTPLLPIIGNHEGSGNLFRDFFSLGDNDDWFAFTYGGVRFIGLNTHNRSYSPGSTQYNWLLEELTSDAYTNATWHIVYFHHPPYTATENHSDDMNVQEYLVPLFEQYGVDMVFNGHSHAYERYFHNGIYYIVTGGGGAPLRNVITDTKEPIREFGESTYHHCVIDVTAETLTLYACYNDGTAFDTITLPPVDETPPTASLLVPLDGGQNDLDGDDGEVTVNTTQSSFQIQLSDVGDGIDDATFITATVALTKDSVPLTEGTHYTIGYDTDLDVIMLTPTDSDFDNGLYAITLSGIADIAGNPMELTTFTIEIDTSIVVPEMLSFQQGVNGYIGTVDTMLQEASPGTNNAGAASLNVDSDEPPGTDQDVQALVGFEEIFGSGPGQMPLEAQILSATLELEVTNLGHSFDLHEMLQSWSETATWNSIGDGIQADGEEAAATPTATTGPVGTGALSIDVTSSISAWRADPSANHGWVMLPTGTDGVDFDSSEGTIPPKLIVTFLPGPDTTPPTIDLVLAMSETTVAVVFSEPVELTSAETVSNYAIDQGVTISSATADTETVVLTTVLALSEGVTYTLTVNNVTDCASTPNPIVPDTQETFQYISNPPVAYWALDEVSGTTAVDSSGNNDGILKNGATFTEFGRYAGAVVLDGTDDYIQVESTVTPYPPLGLPTFTLAAWFKRAGVGDTANTGTGGFLGEPLVTKGLGEADGDNRDMNYFLGLIQSGSDWVLAADFEEHITGTTPGLNHPVTGVTPIANDQWHHAAVTYDGLQWDLYLDGIPDGTSFVDQPPNFESIQFAAIGGALNSSGARDGAFNGTIDEVFIFEGALSPQEIVNLMGNLPPVADAGDDQTVTDSDENGSELITLDGFASSDPDGEITTYEWKEGANVLGDTVSITMEFTVGTHTITLTVTDNEGATDSDDVVITVDPAPDTDPPTAPIDLTATAVSSSQIDLDWADNGESDLSHYNVYRSTTSDDPYTQIASNVMVSSYSDTGLTASTTYYYVVTAVDTAANESDNSSEVSATTDSLQTVSVESIDMEVVSGKKYYATATVTITPGLGGATVVGDWYFKGVLRLSGDTGVTDADGIAVLTSFTTPAKSGDTFTFTVTDVVASGYTYDDSLNVETSDSIDAP